MSTGVVNAGRRAAEWRMRDQCKVTQPGSAPPIYDPETDTYIYPGGSLTYEGWCQVRPAALRDIDAEAGASITSSRTYVVKLPISAITVRRDNVVEIIASELDAGLIGTRMRVLGALKGSHITSRRLACEEVTS